MFIDLVKSRIPFVVPLSVSNTESRLSVLGIIELAANFRLLLGNALGCLKIVDMMLIGTAFEDTKIEFDDRNKKIRLPLDITIPAPCTWDVQLEEQF